MLMTRTEEMVRCKHFGLYLYRAIAELSVMLLKRFWTIGRTSKMFVSPELLLRFSLG
jgi:hypothetical protein